MAIYLEGDLTLVLCFFPNFWDPCSTYLPHHHNHEITEMVVLSLEEQSNVLDVEIILLTKPTLSGLNG